MISRVVVYISRTLGDGLSLYILYPLGSTVLSARTSIFWMLTGGTAVLRCRSLLGCNRHIVCIPDRVCSWASFELSVAPDQSNGIWSQYSTPRGSNNNNMSRYCIGQDVRYAT